MIFAQWISLIKINFNTNLFKNYKYQTKIKWYEHNLWIFDFDENHDSFFFLIYFLLT